MHSKADNNILPGRHKIKGVQILKTFKNLNPSLSKPFLTCLPHLLKVGITGAGATTGATLTPLKMRVM